MFPPITKLLQIEGPQRLGVSHSSYEWHSRGQRFDPAYLHQADHKANTLWSHHTHKIRESNTCPPEAQAVDGFTNQ